jgi:hypothetical protein
MLPVASAAGERAGTGFRRGLTPARGRLTDFDLLLLDLPVDFLPVDFLLVDPVPVGVRFAGVRFVVLRVVVLATLSLLVRRTRHAPCCCP